jgi:hypothetical protein
MKRVSVLFTLVLILVVAFSATAGAKYAGYFLDGAAKDASTTSTSPGYLSWSGAQEMMDEEGVTGAIASSAHGGYITTTTKCAVCHSAHRALSTNNVNKHLAASESCVQCHTTWGTGGATKLIEWAENNGTAGSTGGPHASPGRGCAVCHTGGIHGLAPSQYWGMNAFMLGAVADTKIAAEVVDGLNYEEDYLDPNGSAGSGQVWFFTGSSKSPDQGAVASGTGVATYAAAKATATGYNCGQIGCHENSVFAMNAWGLTLQRDTGNGVVGATGHKATPGIKGSVDAGCGPCHPGNSSGGYRFGAAPGSYSGGASSAAKGAIDSSRAYGCDQCHDLVGVATGTTAFPHGNRGISAYEWTDTGASKVTDLPTAGGNIWMYSASVAQAGAGVPNAGNTVYSKAFTLIQQAVSHGDEPATINDGVCVKCHVANDLQSAKALGAIGATDSEIPAEAMNVPNHGGFADVYADWEGMGETDDPLQTLFIYFYR